MACVRLCRRRSSPELRYPIIADVEVQFAEDSDSPYLFGKKHRRLLVWLNHWVLIWSADDGAVGQIIVRPHGERHIGTNEW